MTYSLSSIAALASDRHIGQKVQMIERIRWVRMPGRKDQDSKDQIVWWPGILYKNFRELSSDLDERLIEFRAKCIQQHTARPSKPVVAYFLGFVPPLVRTITNNSSCSTSLQENKDNFGLKNEIMDSEVKDFYSSYLEMQKLANNSNAPQKHKEMFKHFVTLAENIISVSVEIDATKSGDQTEKEVDIGSDDIHIRSSLLAESAKGGNKTIAVLQGDIPYDHIKENKLNKTDKDKLLEMDGNESNLSRFSEDNIFSSKKKIMERPSSSSIESKVFDVEENPRRIKPSNSSCRVSHLEVNNRRTSLFPSDESTIFSGSNFSVDSFWRHFENDESNGLDDRYRIRSNRNPDSRKTKLGIHYTNSTEDVIECSRKKKEKSSITTNANKSVVQESDTLSKIIKEMRKSNKMKKSQREKLSFMDNVSLKQSKVIKGVKMRRDKTISKTNNSSVGVERKHRGRPSKRSASKSETSKKRKMLTVMKNSSIDVKRTKRGRPSKTRISKNETSKEGKALPETKNSWVGHELKIPGGQCETSVSKSKTSLEAYRWWSSEPIPDWKDVWKILKSKLMFTCKQNAYVLPGNEKVRISEGMFLNSHFTNPQDMRMYLCQHGIPLHARTQDDESLDKELEQVVRWVSLAHLPRDMNGRKINSKNSQELFDKVELLNDTHALEKLLTIEAELRPDPYNINFEKIDPLKHARSQIRAHGIPPKCQNLSDYDRIALILWSSLLQLPENIIPSTNDQELVVTDSNSSKGKRKSVTEISTAVHVSKRSKPAPSGNMNDRKMNSSLKSIEYPMNGKTSTYEHILIDNENEKSVVTVETATPLKKQRDHMASVIDLVEEKQYKEFLGEVTDISSDEIGDTVDQSNKETVHPGITLSNIVNANDDETVKSVEEVEEVETATPLMRQTNPKALLVNFLREGIRRLAGETYEL